MYINQGPHCTSHQRHRFTVSELCLPNTRSRMRNFTRSYRDCASVKSLCKNTTQKWVFETFNFEPSRRDTSGFLTGDGRSLSLSLSRSFALCEVQHVFIAHSRSVLWNRLPLLRLSSLSSSFTFLPLEKKRTNSKNPLPDRSGISRITLIPLIIF